MAVRKEYLHCCGVLPGKAGTRFVSDQRRGTLLRVAQIRRVAGRVVRERHAVLNSDGAMLWRGYYLRIDVTEGGTISGQRLRTSENEGCFGRGRLTDTDRPGIGQPGSWRHDRPRTLRWNTSRSGGTDWHDLSVLG